MKVWHEIAIRLHDELSWNASEIAIQLGRPRYTVYGVLNGHYTYEKRKARKMPSGEQLARYNADKRAKRPKNPRTKMSKEERYFKAKLRRAIEWHEDQGLRYMGNTQNNITRQLPIRE
jgi:hypothetical protein